MHFLFHTSPEASLFLVWLSYMSQSGAIINRIESQTLWALGASVIHLTYEAKGEAP